MKKDTFFNNSTERAKVDTNQPTSKSKRKILKACGFGSLAVMMAVAGTFAFAPLGITTNNLATANESGKTTYTTEQGLITPKADDPVIYTTESGLEIKFGNAPSVSNSLSSGNLNGFPYFTTTKNSITYTWVIIGRSTSITDTQTFLWQNWKNGNKDFYKYMSYFFGDSYEINTPAGNAINATTPSKSYVVDILKNTKPKATSEIPAGCVLAYANTVWENQPFCQNQTTTNGAGETGYYMASLNDTFGGTTNKLTQILSSSYYQNDNFGFGTNKSLLQNTSLTQYVSYYYYGGQHAATTCSLYFFPLDYNETYSNFRFQTYLTKQQIAASSNFWTRSNTTAEAGDVINTSGEVITYRPQYFAVGDKQGVRPACVIKIF